MISPFAESLRRPLALILAVAPLWIVVSAVAAAQGQTKTVRLVIDYGDGVQLHFTALPWREGMTALDALAAAAKHPRGPKIAQRGSGATAIVTQIADLKNGQGDKNWLYSVGDKPGEVSAGAQRIQAGSRVLWEFKTYDYNSTGQ